MSGARRRFMAVVAMAAAVMLGTAGRSPGQRPGPAPGIGEQLKQQIRERMKAARIDRDVEYARVNGKSLRLDLYRPAEGQARGPLPVVVWVHGGGWKMGSKDTTAAANLAAFGFAVASINYRLSQEAVFPAQIQDCRAAIRWLRAKASYYDLDPKRVGAWGSSAGGHLVALLGTAPEQPGWDVGEHLDQSSRVQAVCDFFGPTDLVTAPTGQRAGDGLGMVEQLLGGLPTEKRELARQASPLAHVSKGDPPFFIAHGANDDLVPPNHSLRLHQALLKARVPSTLLIVQKAGHGFDERSVPPLPAINLQVLRFFQTALRVR